MSSKLEKAFRRMRREAKALGGSRSAFSLEEVCRALEVPSRTLERMIKAGFLAVVEVDGERRVPASELRRMRALLTR